MMESTTKYKDPICGTTVSPERAAGKIEHDGETFYFCSTGCLEKFKNQIDNSPAAVSMTQTRREKPVGEKANKFVDPVCGMTVTPETAAAKYEGGDGVTVYFCAEGCKSKYISDLANSNSEMYESATANVSTHGVEKVVPNGAMKAAPEGEFIDPVCGMSVAPESAAGKYDFEVETYYFCSTGCKAKFEADPAEYAD